MLVRANFRREPEYRVRDVRAPQSIAVGSQVLAVIGRPFSRLRETQRVDVAAWVDDGRQIVRQLVYPRERLVRRPTFATPRRPDPDARQMMRGDWPQQLRRLKGNPLLWQRRQHTIAGHVVAKLYDQQIGMMLLDKVFEQPCLDLWALVDSRLVGVVPLGTPARQLGLRHPIVRLRAADAIGMDDRALIDEAVLQRTQEEIFRGDMTVADDQHDQPRESGFHQQSVLLGGNGAKNARTTLSSIAVKKGLDALPPPLSATGFEPSAVRWHWRYRCPRSCSRTASGAGRLSLATVRAARTLSSRCRRRARRSAPGNRTLRAPGPHFLSFRRPMEDRPMRTWLPRPRSPPPTGEPDYRPTASPSPLPRIRPSHRPSRR